MLGLLILIGSGILIQLYIRFCGHTGPTKMTFHTNDNERNPFEDRLDNTMEKGDIDDNH